ncbi:hypothetical protein G9A89_002821 [Geosiphon pyriformis]|nr:hypothetical protein G9A89_002821 [Geosiphon pyriformis]
MKKAAKSSSSDGSFEMVLSRKKRRGETGNTTESKSVDMEEECLVKETSFDYGEGGALAGGDHDQTPTDSKVKTKKTLGKPLGKIDFSKGSDDNSVLLDAPLELSPPIKNLVNVPVKKSFALDIGLDKVASKSSQKKLVVAVVIKKILIGTSAEAVHTALSEFGVIKAIKMQLIGLSMGGKTCVIDCHPVTYAWTRCAVVCFDSAESLNAAVEITPILKNANLCWSCLISTKCTKYEKLGHTLLDCVVGRKFSSGNLLHRVFSNIDKSRLAAIYAKRSAPVACLVSFGGLSWAKVACGSSSLPLSSQNVLVDDNSSSEMKPSLLVTMEVNNRFAALKCSLTSLTKQVGKLAKRLNTLGSMVPQPSPECQPLVTLSSQDQGVDVVMSESSGVFTGGGTVAEVVSFNMSSVSKLKDSMKYLMETVLGLLTKVDSIGVHSVSLPLIQ